MPICAAVSATFPGPTMFVSWAKTVLSEYAIAVFRLIGPMLLCSKFVTLQARPPASSTTGWETRIDDGAIPSRSAAARTNGLNAEPGWRSPCVARLNWLARKLRPPIIATTWPVWTSIATSAALGPIDGGSTLSIASRAIFCSPRSIVRHDLHPAAEHVPRAVARRRAGS